MKTKRWFAFALALLLLLALAPAPHAHADEDLSWTDEECPKAKELGYDPPIHDINWETLQQGNCTVETITKVYCTICGRSTITRYAPGHDWDEGVVTKEATCTEAGEITYTCHRLITNTWCGEQRTESIPALGHDWDSGTVTKAATCAEEGVKTYTCSRCGDTKTEAIPITAGHTFGPWTTTKEPTCLAEGQRERTCTVCGYAETETLPKGAHTPSEAPAKAATCTEPGHGAGSVCSVCGAVLAETETIPALGHAWDGGAVTKAATCTEAGVKTYTCSRCGEKKTETIPATGHTFGAWSTTKAATCTTEGQRARQCTSCGYTETETLPKTAHTPSTAPAKEPTCTEPGHGAGSVCAVCGAALSETEAIAALGHLWDGGTVTKVPTETEEGEITYTCQRDPSHTKTAKLPATGTEPKPNAWFGIFWKMDAGKGKCYEGAEVPVQKTVVNIGNVPITVKTEDGSTVTLQPKEYTSWDYSWKVESYDVPRHKIERDQAWAYKDLDGKTFHTNKVNLIIPLTYPEGVTPPEPAPSVKLEMVPENAFKEVYPHDGGDVFKSEKVEFDLKGINTGNVPLDLYEIKISSKGAPKSSPGLMGSNVTPGGSCSSPGWIKAYSNWVTPEPEDSPYFGSRTMEWYVVGYEPGANPATAAPLCESNHIIRTYKIARPEAEDWTLPEKLSNYFFKVEKSHPSDPNGYQVGERIDYYIGLYYLYQMEEIKGFSDLVLDDPNACSTIEKENKNGAAHVETEPGVKDYIGWDLHAYHIVTPEDADNGYVTNTATAKFIDSVTGEPVEMTTNTVTSTVLGKPKTLTVSKALAKPPANGKYYEEGEEIEYTIVITNNTDKTYTNIEVKDGGGVIATIDKLEPGEASDPIHYSGGTVTALDKSIMVIKNVATVTATDEDGNMEIITSTEVSAPTDPDGDKDYKPDPDKGNDPMGKIDGVVAGVYVSKTETSAPANGLWYEEGETITYGITVKNTGEVEATNIVVRDSLEKAGLGVIDTIGSLAPGESKSIAYQHTVTTDDVDHGIVINYATATWQYEGKAGVPVTSEKVKSYTSEEGLTTGVTGGITPPVKEDDTTPKLDPDGEIIEDSTGTPILVHADGSYVSCMLDIQAANDGAATYTLRHCREHEAVAKAAAELLEGNEDSLDAWNAVAELWLNAVEKGYQDLYEAAWGDAAGALLLAHDRFMAELRYETELLYTTADRIAGCRRITEIMRLHCTELCHILHGGEPTDSLTNAYAELGGVAPGETCARSVGEGEADATYMELYCEEHAEIMAALRGNLARSLSNVAEANSFGTGASMWQKALDTQVNAKYRAADAAGKKLIAKTRKGLDLYRQALRPLYEILYPENLAAPEEAVLGLYRTMAVDLCELWK